MIEPIIEVKILRFNLCRFACMFALLTSASFSYSHSPDQQIQLDLKNSLVEFGRGVAEAYRNTGRRLAPVKASEPDGNGYFVTTVKEVGLGYEAVWIKRDEDQDVSYPLQLMINKKGFRLPGDVVVRFSPCTLVFSRFGNPDEKKGSQMKYRVPGHMEDEIVIFQCQNNVINSVSWFWESD